MSNQKQYKAFISYSREDEDFGAWLHKELEKYKIPKNLREDYPNLPKTLYPIFRDKYELKAGDDLGVEISKALKNSDALIVVCSPKSASSKWVNKEIIEFKMMYGEDKIFPIIVDGVPFAKESENDDNSLECFPEALKYKVDNEGNLTDEQIDRLASNIHKKDDGEELAKSKLIAGVLGVPFGEFHRRDEEQKRIELEEEAEKERLLRNRDIKRISIVAVIMTIIAIYAFMQKNIAVENRKKLQLSEEIAKKETKKAKKNEEQSKKNEIISKSNELATLSSYYLNLDPVLSFRLAEKASLLHDGTLSNQALIKSYYQGIFYKQGSKKKFFKNNKFLLYGSHIYTENNNTVLIYKRDHSGNYKVLHRIKVDNNFKTLFSTDIDERFLFIYNNKENIFINLGDDIIKKIEIGKKINKANFSKNGLYLSLITDDNISIYSDYGIKKLSIPNENNISNFIVSDSMELRSSVANKIITIKKNSSNKNLIKKKIGFDVQTMFFINEDKEIILCGDNNLTIFDIKSGKKIFTKNTDKTIIDCKISETKSIEYLLYVTGDKYNKYSPIKQANIINLKEKKKILFNKKLSNLYSSDFIYNTNIFYTMNKDYSIDLWFFSSAQKYKTLYGHYSIVQSLIPMPYRRILTVADDDFIRSWSPAKTKGIFAINDKGNFNIHRSAFISRDSKYIIEASGDGVKLFNINTKKIILKKILYNKNKTKLIKNEKERKFKEGYNESIFKINKQYLYGYTKNNSSETSVNIFDFQGNFIADRYDIKDRIMYFDFAYLSNLLVLASLDNIYIWSIKGQKMCSIKAKDKEFFSSVKFILNTDEIITSSMVYTSHKENIIKIYDKTCQLIKKYELPSDMKINNVFKTRDEHRMILLNEIYGNDTNKIVLFDTVNNSFKNLYRGGFNFKDITMNDKQELLAVIENQFIKILDIDGRELAVINFKQTIKSIQFSSDNNYLLVYSHDGAKLYPISSKKIIEIINNDKSLGAFRELTDEEKKLFNIK